MGERISHEVRGIYYLVTEAKQPYWKATMAESVNCEEVKFHDGTNEAS